MGNALPSKCSGFGAFTIFPEFDIDFFPVSFSEVYSERTRVREHRVSPNKTDESTDRSIEKWFPEMLPKALRTLARAYSTQEKYH
jgi:hypothetical protein